MPQWRFLWKQQVIKANIKPWFHDKIRYTMKRPTFCPIFKFIRLENLSQNSKFLLFKIDYHHGIASLARGI